MGRVCEVGLLLIFIEVISTEHLLAAVLEMNPATGRNDPVFRGNLLLVSLALSVGGCQELPSAHTKATSPEISILGQFPTSSHGSQQNALRWKASGNPEVHLFIPHMGIFNTQEHIQAQEKHIIGTIYYQ
ncbi:MAG: hypothetical protein L0Y80_06330 [Ignavibacteriae bacterium]|nr:hypothetical protein [Ignavibacteriota bacterium]